MTHVARFRGSGLDFGTLVSLHGIYRTTGNRMQRVGVLCFYCNTYLGFFPAKVVLVA